MHMKNREFCLSVHWR